MWVFPANPEVGGWGDGWGVVVTGGTKKLLLLQFRGA